MLRSRPTTPSSSFKIVLCAILVCGSILYTTKIIQVLPQEINCVSTFDRVNSNHTIEDLLYKYKSDKSRDDHGYSKLYNMIFSPIRHTVKNMTEVGISAGQSLQAWYRYFPAAEIHAFDVRWFGEDLEVSVKDNIAHLKPRVKPHIVNILTEVDNMAELGFLPESMDIIIEDGPHSLESQQGFLVKLFPLVKPGGYYIIEDVGWVQKGVGAFHEDPSKLLSQTRDILESHETIWVDTSAGHRGWDQWQKATGRMWVQDRVKHNSYCLVIQKREKALPPFQMNYNNGAMSPASIVRETGDF